jgi:hypothetical protein
MKRLALSLIVLTFLVAGCGQKPVVWQYRIDIGGDETATSIATDGANLYVGATATKTGGSDRAALLVTKLSLQGKELWSQLYKDAPHSTCEDVAADSTGACFAVGRIRPQQKTACLVVRYGLDGRIAWQKGLELGDKTWGMGITKVGADKLAICGLAGTDANADHMIALLDAADGRTIWARNYDLCCADIARRITSDDKGNLAVVGQHGDGTAVDIVVMKLKPNGDTLWTRIYDSGGEDKAGDIAFDQFGNVLVTGTAVVADSTHCVILEYDPDGGVIRKSAYGQQAQAEGNGICVTAASDIFIAGTLLRRGASGVQPEASSILAFQYKPSAQSIWERHYAPAGTGAAGADLVVTDNAYIVANVKGKTADALVCCFSRPLPPKR